MVLNHCSTATTTTTTTPTTTMPLNKKWRSLDFFGSLENLHLPGYHSHHQRKHDRDKHKSDPLGKDKEKDKHKQSMTDLTEFEYEPRPRLSSLSLSERGGAPELRRDSDVFENSAPLTGGGAGLVQRCVIIQKDERGYGLTVSGDNPVYVASVKLEGAAAKAGVQKDDRIVKVNGTLVTNKNHIDVVKLIKSGSYVALTLMGRPNSASSPGGNQPGSSPFPSRTPSNASNRDSTLITGPRPVDPDKDKELLQQKVHMTQVMFEQAKEDYEKHQRQYVRTPSEKLHTSLLEKERTVKTLENQLKQLTGVEDPTTPSFTQGSQRFDVDSDFSSINSNRATSFPSEGSMSDSPQTSPSISPTPVHPYNNNDDPSRGDSGVEDSAPMPAEIITIDDEDVNSDDETHLGTGLARQWSGNRSGSPFLTKLQTAEKCDTGPFSDIKLLEKKPAHMGVFLHYLISNSDPNSLFFYIVTTTFKESGGNTKDLRKWGYEIFSTFLAPTAPLHVEVGETLVAQVNELLMAVPGKSENENVLRTMFDGCRAALTNEIGEQLADFRNKRDLGLGNIFGVHELKENMDKGKEIKMVEKYLMPHLIHCTQVTPQEEKEMGRKLTDRDQAFGWALATFFRQVGVSKTSSHGNILERVQSFIMKDKRGFKIPGSRSTKAKAVKNHQFNLTHFLAPTFCAKCEGLIWGVGYQGFTCQSCEMGIHKQCVEDVQEVCSGKKRGKRASAFIPIINSRKPSNPVKEAVTEALNQAGETRSPPHTMSDPFGSNPVPTQPLKKEDEILFALNLIAGLPTEHSVKSIVSRYHNLNSPTGPGPGEEEEPVKMDRKGSTDLGRSESLKGKGDKSERPPRRAKSDVDSNDMFKAINQQSGSSSASSLSNRSVESPSASTDNVNDALAASRAHDSDLEVEELPPLKQVLGEDVCKKLKPKEKKRQEVINELFHTEKAHLRNLKVLDILFNKPMMMEQGVMKELARSLFPNMEEMIVLHANMNSKMKERRNQSLQFVVGDVGDILLERFDNEEGERFRKACAEYCRNQSYALDALKKHRRKDARLSQFLGDQEADKLCRKLELKDHVPCEMQRLTKYPMLIENLMKYSQPTSEEYKNLETALDRSRKILAYVNQAVRECENYHKLKEWQKKLDKRAIDTSSDPTLKELDLTRHKLVHDGFLVWRLRSHRLIELQVLLLEDILVLLQRVDDRLVLKCQSTNQQSIGNDYKYTHSPVLKLQNLLARNVATDKKAFFVINTSDTGPQIYELVAPTQDARKMWCKLINEKADEHKRGMMSQAQMGRIQKSTPSPQPDEITMVRSRIMRKSQEPSPPPPDEGQAAAPAFVPPEPDQVDTSVSSLATAEFQPELIQPNEVNVSDAVTAQALPVLSPLERLRRNDQCIDQALSEKEEIVAEMLHLSLTEYQHLAQRAHNVGNLEEEEEEYDEQSLVVSCIQSNNRLIQLIASRASSLASNGAGSESGSGSASGSGPSTAQPSSLPSENESELSRLRQQQELLAQGAAGQDVNVPIPMDQLRGMANEMNSILSNLLHVMGTRGAERQSLRQELAAAQDQLEMLKAIQRQMMEQQQEEPSSTPQSRPQSFVSVASSVSEATDGDNTEDDPASSLLNVAVEQEQITEMEEAVKPLVTEVQPQETTATGPVPDDDSDDACDMYPENLPLPDDSSISADTAYATAAVMEVREEEDGASSMDAAMDIMGFAEPMTTDLDEGGDDGRSTPTPSPTPMGRVDEEGREDDGDTDSIITISTDTALVGGEEGHPLKAVAEEQQELPLDNNNSSSQDSELTNPIDV
ncbi:rho guanine nucleotide exchange factor 11-like isoform X4 [Littorina saxatilis]|uniref:rho guanine nucleotide exchange factor 11-like isoform X4 n=1 Tax=Littorina saxatilis TaxID=31220 RepID=UPI0038B566E6